MRIILPIVALALVVMFGGCFLAACAALDTKVEAIPAKPHHTIEHRATKHIPAWSEERLILNNEHDDLITADGRRIAGAP